MTAQLTPLHPVFESWNATFGDRNGIELPAAVTGTTAEYDAARKSAAIFDGGDRGWIEMGGPDARDFLQRVLSSDLRKLVNGSGMWSALLEAKGKWISDLLLYSYERNDARFGLDCPASRAASLEAKLEKLHFTDRIQWKLLPYTRLLVVGPESEAMLAAAGMKAPKVPANAPTTRHGVFAAAVTKSGIVLRRPDRGTPCVEVLGVPTDIAKLAKKLHDAGAVAGGTGALDILRIESFLPRYGIDFDCESSLPESNEWHRASLSKGCYAGQEVVAKVNTYGEAPWQLCHLRFDNTVGSMQGCELRDECDKIVGRVTSWADSPLHGGAIGLGSVRRKFAVDGCKLTATRGEVRSQATVTVPEKVLG